ncbi:MAG: hypothetical protein GY699_01490, partial [Desulfobacteraceae bacterium]|nr:hypothetical protein [Desulfobacteraceae bacterium]
MIKKSAQLFIGTICLIFLFSFSVSADVTVYAEGAYTADDLVIYIYADVTPGDPIVSYGIKLTYDHGTELVALAPPPAKITVADLDDLEPGKIFKNTDVWYFGESGAASLPTPNADPDTTTPGEVVIVGGKIDQANPTEGVEGSRQLIAVVSFARQATSEPIPFTPTLGLSLGKTTGSYANFVKVAAGAVLDDPGIFGDIEVYRRGNANKDDKVSMLDMASVRDFVLNAQYRCYADANADGKVSMLDMETIRNIVLGI